MKKEKDMPASKALNSKWQIFIRRYGSGIEGLAWSFFALVLASASIASQGVSITGVFAAVVGLGGVLWSLALISVARRSEAKYDLIEWSEAIRELHGDKATITLNIDGSVTVDNNGQVYNFPTPTDAIRLSGSL